MIDIYKFIKNNIKIELVYNHKNNVQIIFKSAIQEVLDGKIVITKPENKTTLNFDDIPQLAKFNIVIYTEEGVLSGNVNLMSNDNNLICISFPYNNQFCQRREDTRIPMHINFEIKTPNTTYNVVSKNISGKGIACITETPMQDFENSKITMHFPTGDINAICRKVYSKQTDYNNKVMFLNGITFTEISEDDIKKIVKNCLKFQLDSKYNERLFETL